MQKQGPSPHSNNYNHNNNNNILHNIIIQLLLLHHCGRGWEWFWRTNCWRRLLQLLPWPECFLLSEVIVWNFVRREKESCRISNYLLPPGSLSPSVSVLPLDEVPGVKSTRVITSAFPTPLPAGCTYIRLCGCVFWWLCLCFLCFLL